VILVSHIANHSFKSLIALVTTGIDCRGTVGIP
jgi:hypothetical protein